MAAELEKELARDGYGRALLSTTALLRLLVQLGKEQRREDRQQPQPVNPRTPRVQKLMHHIDSHLAEDLDIDALSETFFVSKFHMMRLFKAQTGFTIHTYLLQRRLLAARQLIERGMLATEACYRCGFRSYSSFTRAYSKHFGSTPTGRLCITQAQTEGME
jgi:AraC-like DNA-binding protein